MYFKAKQLIRKAELRQCLLNNVEISMLKLEFENLSTLPREENKRS